MLVREAVDDFLMLHGSRLSDKTLRWYRQKLEAWLEDLGDRDLETITPASVARYVAGLQGISTYTRRGYAQVIKGFFSWLVANDYLAKWNTKALAMPKVDQKLIEVFTAPQIKQLLEACRHEQTPALVARDRLLILFLLDTGVRASELCGLTLASVSVPDRQARVLGKGRKERVVGFGAETARQLVLYLRRYRRAKPGVETVFVNRYGEPLTPNGVDQMLYRLAPYTRISGIRISAHTFRHTFAVWYLLGGGDVMSLKLLLGHVDIGTTQLYLKALESRQVVGARPSLVDTVLTS